MNKHKPNYLLIHSTIQGVVEVIPFYSNFANLGGVYESSQDIQDAPAEVKQVFQKTDFIEFSKDTKELFCFEIVKFNPLSKFSINSSAFQNKL